MKICDNPSNLCHLCSKQKNYSLTLISNALSQFFPVTKIVLSLRCLRSEHGSWQLRYGSQHPAVLQGHGYCQQGHVGRLCRLPLLRSERRSVSDVRYVPDEHEGLGSRRYVRSVQERLHGCWVLRRQEPRNGSRCQHAVWPRKLLLLISAEVTFRKQKTVPSGAVFFCAYRIQKFINIDFITKIETCSV